jgi:hypothetical protein
MRVVLDETEGMTHMSWGVEAVDRAQIPELLAEVAASLRDAIVSTDGCCTHSGSYKVDDFGSVVSSKSCVLHN